MKKDGKKPEFPLAPLGANKAGLWGIPMTDPLGSYTGVPVPPLEEPVQDADDL